jgi:hypothetical protein
VTSPQVDRAAALLRAAFEMRDLGTFGALLSDDVWWGDDDRPPRCHGRSDVLTTFSRLVSRRVDATVTDIAVGPFGFVAIMQARWADTRETHTETTLYHAYLVRGGLVMQISRYEALDPALEAIGA